MIIEKKVTNPQSRSLRTGIPVWMGLPRDSVHWLLGGGGIGGDGGSFCSRGWLFFDNVIPKKFKIGVGHLIN